MDETLRLWGANIRARRLMLNSDGKLRSRADEPVMTQEQLGLLLDPPVRQSTVYRWEEGQMEPRRQYKRQLANVLESDVAMLFPLVRSAS